MKNYRSLLIFSLIIVTINPIFGAAVKEADTIKYMREAALKQYEKEAEEARSLMGRSHALANNIDAIFQNPIANHIAEMQAAFKVHAGRSNIAVPFFYDQAATQARISTSTCEEENVPAFLTLNETYTRGHEAELAKFVEDRVNEQIRKNKASQAAANSKEDADKKQK